MAIPVISRDYRSETARVSWQPAVDTTDTIVHQAAKRAREYAGLSDPSVRHQAGYYRVSGSHSFAFSIPDRFKRVLYAVHGGRP